MAVVLEPKSFWGRAVDDSSVIGGLLATIWVLPMLAAVLTIVTYLTELKLPNWLPGVGQPPAIVGPVVSVLVWVVLGLVYSGFATAASANRSSFGELSMRAAELVSRLANCIELKDDECLYSEARTHSDYLETVLPSGGTRWVTGMGYITAWQRLHRAEETLLLVEDRTTLLADAIHDELRLTGSTMDNADVLMKMLVAAETYLRQHVLGAVVLARAAGAAAPSVIAAPMAAPAPSSGTVQVTTEPEARAAVHEVRRGINEFRDDTWAGLVRARNQLVKTLIVAELPAFLLLELAVLMKAPSAAVLAGVTFFLIGALVGVFNRLNVQAKTDTAVDDYGLATARLIVTPFFSGIAAVIGVALVGMLYSAGLAEVVQPAAAGAATKVAVPTLSQIFNLQAYPIGLIVAAVFGLTPTLVFDRLNKLTEGYKSDIKSTEPSNTAPQKPPDA